jgi:excisionase family DNA binding protein
MSLITTNEVAERLGVTIRRIQALITDGRLPAQKVGRDYLIKEEDLKLVTGRKPGRPRKSKTATVENTGNKGRQIK